MNDDDSQKSSMDDTIFDIYTEKLEEFYDDFQQPLLEPQASEARFPRENYNYKQFLGIRIVLLPLLVVFISLAAWMNNKQPQCES